MADTGQPSHGAAHKWKFFRASGFDQVRLDTGADLLALDQLDRKLWFALSCPTRGVELDARTLALIDTDQDGRIRVPEILEAVKWVGEVLKNPDDLTKGVDGLPLSAIDDGNPEGKQLLASAKQILVNLGKADASVITIDDTADTARIFAQTLFNGDGVVPPEAAKDDAVKGVMNDIIACVGSEPDRSGLAGITQAQADKFFSEAQAYADWAARADAEPAATLSLGDRTAAAAEALKAVQSKVDDYFARCDLAAFDPKAAGPLNPAEADYSALAVKELAAEGDAVRAFPVARVASGRPLPLKEGLNPAWKSAMERFRDEAVRPVLGDKESLTGEEWASLVARFAPYETWMAEKAGGVVEALGIARVREVLAGGMREAVTALIDQDMALKPEADAIAGVERLVRYCRDLYLLLKNFVSFQDFYTRKAKASFQAGTLYLDGRACELCVRVDDMAKHGALATLSRTYLTYCDCSRKGSAEKMTIAAAFTDGDSDQLLVGRNGIFFDRKGQDWDATIVKIVDHPISIRQAFWAPYKRVVRMISEQAEKIAAARAKAGEDKAAKVIADAGAHVEAGKVPAAPAQPFDVGKFAGIFAAIGLAVGAIGTALAAVATGFFSLAWWKMPLALVGVVLAISGPSMLLAWFKLRQRNLAPILDANGWAVNTRAKINIPFGAALTSVAALPAGSERSLVDPFAEKKRPWGLYLVVLIIVVTAVVLWIRGYIPR
ncbi:MAG: hypothetical protein HZB55_16785 [Deltaproteobacteria bacterium]|nr:hypothetical protein [Deltaproteobacteria bacterium]